MKIMEIKQDTKEDKYNMVFTRFELQLIYIELLGIKPIIYPEDKMKILMSIRKSLDWTEITEETK